VTGCLVINYDVTVLKSLTEKLNALASLQKASSGWLALSYLVSCDRQGVVQTLNLAAERALGYAREKVSRASHMLWHDSTCCGMIRRN
jgi:PAS domain-containing protein